MFKTNGTFLGDMFTLITLMGLQLRFAVSNVYAITIFFCTVVYFHPDHAARDLMKTARNRNSAGDAQ